MERLTAAGRAAAKRSATRGACAGLEPLADKQWDMQMIDCHPQRLLPGQPGTPRGHGQDHGHGHRQVLPDIQANFNRRLSRNFSTDIPLVDGPCEEEPD